MADAPNSHTDLALSGPGVMPYSARGLHQTLLPIAQSSNNRRTVNGELIDISATQFRKYGSTITGGDQQPPALDGVWPGLSLQVDCVAELSYLTQGGAPAKTAVPGSSYTDGDWTIYRPRLQMKVLNFSIDRDEYGRQVSWSVQLEEV